MGKAISSNLPEDLGHAGGFTASVMAGGIASELGGGKFKNGATSAAFVHLFSEIGAKGGKYLNSRSDCPLDECTLYTYPNGTKMWVPTSVVPQLASVQAAGESSFTDYDTYSNEEISGTLSLVGTSLLTFGSGGMTVVGYITLGGAFVFNQTPSNAVPLVLGPIGRMMGPIDDFFFPAGGMPLTHAIETIGHVHTAASISCTIPLKCP